MIDQQLQNWVREQTGQGVSKDEIRQMLKNTGWQDSDIDQVFSGVESGVTPSTPPPTPGGSSFLGPIQLLKKSLSIYKQRFWTLLGIYFLPILIAVIPIIAIVGIFVTLGILQGGTSSALGIIMMVLVVIAVLTATIILAGWIPSTILYAIKDREERIGIKESYRRSRHLIGAVLWVGFLVGFTVAAGLLLFLIPVVIFSIWFCLSTYVLVAEDIRGMDALMKSKEYIRGRWWGVFGRLLFIQLILLLGTWLIPLIVGSFSNPLATIIGATVSLLGMPLTLIYMFLIYENLRDIKGASVPVTSKKGWFIFFGWLGGLIIPLVILATVVLLSLGSARGMARDAVRTADLNVLRSEAELYFNDHNRYPLSLDELAPYSQNAIPTDPTTHAPYKYTASPDGSDYKLCATTEAKIEKCVTGLTVGQ